MAISSKRKQPLSPSDDERLAKQREDNRKRQKKFRDSKKGWEKVLLSIKTKFTKKKSTAKGRIENSQKFLNSSAAEKKKLLEDWVKKYSEEALEEEISLGKIAWEKKHEAISIN